MKTQIDLSSIIVAPEYRQKITIIRDMGGNGIKAVINMT